MEDNKNSSSFAKGFIIGGLVGAVLALLFAPKKGVELREDIKKRAQTLKEEAEKKYGETKESAQRLVNEVLEQKKS